MNRRERRVLEREQAKREIVDGRDAQNSNLETAGSSRGSGWLNAWMLVPALAVALGVGFGVSGVIASRTGLPVELKGLERFDHLERNHVTGAVGYLERPPVGGNHASVWQNCGVYRQPIKDVTAVHALA